MPEDQNDATEQAAGVVPEKDSISMSLVREALLETSARGFDVEDILLKAEISPSLLPLAYARVSPEQYGKMWHAVACVMDDEFFGLDSHAMRYGSLALACHCAITSKNLRQALRRLNRFYRGLLDDISPQLIEEGDWAHIELKTVTGPRRLFAFGTFFVILHGLVCWLCGRRIPIAFTKFAAPEPDHVDEYRLIFGGELEFNCSTTTLSFDSQFLELPIVQTPATVKTFLRGAPANLLIKFRNPSSVLARVRKTLRSMDPADWPEFPGLAKQYAMTETTLRRRLDAEGQSYQKIKDDFRRDLAVQLLGQPAYSVQAVAEKLGFAEPSAFHRAFRKWTGTTPSAYRPQP